MSQLSAAPSSSLPSNPSLPRTVEITIHRCPDVVPKKVLGAFDKKRDYFVVITVGNENQRTTKRSSQNRCLEWNEKFTFHNVQKSSLTLTLCYERTVLFGTKVVHELTIPLPETRAGDTSPTLSRTVTFRDGPQIQWSLSIKDMDSRPQDVVEETESKVDRNDGDGRGAIEPAEVAETMPEDVNKDRDMAVENNEPKSRGVGDDSKERGAVEEAKQAVDSQSTLAPVWKQVLERVRNVKDVAAPVAEVHSFAKLAWTILNGLSEPFIKQMDRDERLKELLASLISFCDVVTDSKDSELDENERLRGVLRRASLQITDIAFFIRDYCKNGGFVKKALKNLVSGVDNEIQEYCSTLEKLKDEFRTRVAMETEIKVVRILKAMEEISQAINLDDIAYVSGAGLDTDRMCLDGTRAGVLEDIMEWVGLDSSEAQTMWVSGGAGTGKSAIAHTLASRCKQMGRLGSMFCFSETDKASRRPTSLFPHISRDLADLDKSIRVALNNATQNKADRTPSGITAQFEKLVLAPANAIRENMHGPIVIIIDALDECGTVEERRALLQILGSRLKELPPNFRIIITSRPDLDIQMKLPARSDLLIKRMHSIPSNSTKEDVTRFIRKELADEVGLNEKIYQNLALHARGLFQWARVACNFVRDREPGETALGRYKELIRPLASKSVDDIGGDTLLDYLYRAVLSKIFSSKRKTSMDHFKFVMARILTAFEPLSCNSLNQLLQASDLVPEDCKAENVVVYLGSVLSGVDSRDTPIRPLHISFRDFLTSAERSEDFFVSANDADVQLDMTLGCLSIMKAELRFNICRLPTSHLPNKNIPGIEELIAKHISAWLSYGCRFWATHLCSSGTAESIPAPNSDFIISGERWKNVAKEMDDLLRDRILNWLEVLSLLGASNSGLQQIRQVYSLAKIRNVDKEILVWIEDVQKFWSYFAKCIATSAAHIYVSALPFAPACSMISQKYLEPSNKALSIAAGRLQTYPPCLNILYGHTKNVESVAYSSNGTGIVSGSRDKTIRIWNAESGEMVVGPLAGHTDEVNSVAFSPDGNRIASGSNDKTIRVWNAENGEMVLGPLKGHSNLVTSVVFSPDGTLIASGSGDKTIRLWNAENGAAILDPLRGHTRYILSVKFCPTGARIVSGSGDTTIRVWSVKNGSTILGPLSDHTDAVRSVTFSPDGTRIASSSDDKTIRIWDAENGNVILGPLEGHTGVVSSVDFSPDGSRLVSGSEDATIRVWNSDNGQTILGPLQGHTSYILSTIFSPDGTRLISGSYDSTIRIWNAEDQQIDLKPLEGHTDWVNSVTPTPDGTRIISASNDMTIRVWDVENGEMVLGPLIGHTSPIRSVTLSPDGTRVASGSDDNTIRIWSVESGEMILGPLNGHTDRVSSVAFSPDCKRIASSSSDKTIRVWNSENGDMVLGPLTGHTQLVYSAVFSSDGTRIVSAANDDTVRIWNSEDGKMILGPLQGRVAIFSPDGTSIVSGSSDGTIRMWDAENGKIMYGPLEGHTDWINSLAFSPDGSRFASGSDDRTIRVWDAKSGQMILGPLEDHTDFVKSVAFTPGGRRIISGSSDGSIRVWNVENTTKRTVKVVNKQNLPFSAGNCDFAEANLPRDSLHMKDGWSVGENDELLFYVPPVHQLALWGPRTELIISRHQMTKLDMSQFVHGSSWAECFDAGL